MGARVRSIAAVAAVVAANTAAADWDPDNGHWGKMLDTEVRVMSWNVHDGIRSTAEKQEGVNAWTALAMIVAALQPDLLLLQEAGDNNCYGCVDSVATLTTTIELFFDGGSDPFLGGEVTAYVQKYAPGYSLPYIFASDQSDGYNRNVVVSRYPFADLNGDARSQYKDIPYVSADEYAPGGAGGIRGFQLAEMDLPDATYGGDLVIGNAHLKSGSDADSKQQRLEAAQNVAYVIDYWYNGAGTGIPDPHDKIADVRPPASDILDELTPVIIGGDWNEDEQYDGRKGPAEWLTIAESSEADDGTDRDRSDMTFDDAREYFSSERGTLVWGGSKYDYVAWQDSIATLQRAFVFNTYDTPAECLPPELATFDSPSSASGYASDHLPVLADFGLPLAGTVCDADVDGDDDTDLNDLAALLGAYGTESGEPEYLAAADFDGDGDIDLADLAFLLGDYGCAGA